MSATALTVVVLLPACTQDTAPVLEVPAGPTAVATGTATGGPDEAPSVEQPTVAQPSAEPPAGAGTPTIELAAPTGAVPDGWEQHSTAGGRVGFALPAGAEQGSTPNPEAPDVLVDSFVVQDGGTVLSVLWQPWPEDRGAPRDGTVELALQDFRDGFTSGSGLDPATVQQRRLQVQGRPGLEVTGTAAADGTTVSARYLLLERGGLGLVVLAADRVAADEAAGTLLETLRLP